MMTSKFKFIVIVIFIVMSASIAVFKFVQAQILPSSKIIEYQSTPTPSPTPIPWTIFDKISEGKKLLEHIALFVGLKDIPYTEKRVSNSNGKISITDRTIKDPERQIALVLLNTQTGELSKIIVTKRGGELIVPEGYEIEVIERASGIRWNYWATQYKVSRPENTIVILNKWPEPKNVTVKKVVTNSKGKKVTVNQTNRQIEYITYSAYNDDLRRPELVAKGGEYIKATVESAYQKLKERNVQSRALPGKNISEVSQLKTTFFEKIPLMEQTDLGEFLLDAEHMTDRVKVVLATNEIEAFAKTCNRVSACGWIQFTPGTYSAIRKSYSKARLEPDFVKGAADHTNSMMAAILLYDYNLSNLIKNHGIKIADDPRLEEYLAAAYNGSPKWVDKSLKAVIAGAGDWIGHLKNETKGFIAKLRLIRDNNLL